MLKVNHTINDEDPITVSRSEYDELDQLSGKFLHGGKISTTFDYNIRGWMIGINEGGSPGRFGMELAYNDVEGGVVEPQYNGNIASMKWQSKSEIRQYGFSYDAGSRLKAAEYASGSGGDYSVDGIDYDANGNMTRDYNKSIYEGISYNHLNMPEHISFRGGYQTMGFTWDASGNKLAVETRAQSALGDSTIYNRTTEYSGNFVYRRDSVGDLSLSYILFDEGRITRDQSGNYRYEYFIKDHLGNVRMVKRVDGGCKYNKLPCNNSNNNCNDSRKSCNDSICICKYSEKYAMIVVRLAMIVNNTAMIIPGAAMITYIPAKIVENAAMIAPKPAMITFAYANVANKSAMIVIELAMIVK